MKCKHCIANRNILSCTVDQKDLHHSYDDKPALIFDNVIIWYKHGLEHRENNPSAIWNNGLYSWFYENKSWIETKQKPENNTILIDRTYDFCKNYHNKITIILKQMKPPYNNVYLCLIDNEKRYVQIND